MIFFFFFSNHSWRPPSKRFNHHPFQTYSLLSLTSIRHCFVTLKPLEVGSCIIIIVIVVIAFIFNFGIIVVVIVVIIIEIVVRTTTIFIIVIVMNYCCMRNGLEGLTKINDRDANIHRQADLWEAFFFARFFVNNVSSTYGLKKTDGPTDGLTDGPTDGWTYLDLNLPQLTGIDLKWSVLTVFDEVTDKKSLL